MKTAISRDSATVAFAPASVSINLEMLMPVADEIEASEIWMKICRKKPNP